MFCVCSYWRIISWYSFLKGFQGRWICWAVFSLDNGYLFLKTIEQFICFYFMYVDALLSCNLWTLWVQCQQRPERAFGRYRAGVTAECELLVLYKSEECSCSLSHLSSPCGSVLLQASLFISGWVETDCAAQLALDIQGHTSPPGLGRPQWSESGCRWDLCLVHESMNFNWVSLLFSLQFICWQYRRVSGTRSAMPFLENTTGVKSLCCLVLHVTKSSHE